MESDGRRHRPSLRPGFAGLVVALAAGLLLGCAAPLVPALAPTPTPIPTLTPTITPSPTPTITPSPTPTVTPRPTPTPTPPPPSLSLIVEPEQVLQGHTLLVQVTSNLPVRLSGTLEGRPLAFAGGEAGYWTVVGIPAVAKPGPYELTVHSTDALDRSATASAVVQVVEAGYPTESITLPPDRLALLDPKLVRAEAEKLDAIFTTVTATPLWEGTFTRPITTEVTSAFGTRRSYNGGPARSFHEGVDFRGPLGVPVTAPAAGRVVLAEGLTVRGNGVILDHGLGVYSGFWHLSEIKAQVGELVQPGQVIATVGGTGLATGPHLHWEIRVGNVNVDPLEWTVRRFYPKGN